VKNVFPPSQAAAVWVLLFNRLGDYSPTSRPLADDTMKILHALVCYLAVIALPFHPFAFASPFAIYYDGYVNTTQNNIDSALMEHFLGTIVETCQTVNVTTQNHDDNALMKRVSGDIIETRQTPAITVLGIVAIVAFVTVSIAWIESDDPVRCNSLSSTLIKSLLPETQSVYPKHCQPDAHQVATHELGYLPLLIFHRV
jgi:hypothetical protein